ncbi:monoamine oxidase [Herbaspirillum sp. CF444]|uniref:flavin monoamine oxidase family protein n=1 Tax=Herbaspirillum sp. CF444 TaxID=1144319 RepID=UPI00027239F1|nr:FAD-dependent oxidoreductase [Herbaspirillum sp. CF444]EJL90434.1 monoamine oxidase [Herbaspirillum sp. CF444]
MGLSRRDFIVALSIVAGHKPALAAMNALGAVDATSPDAALAQIRSTPAQSGKGKSVIVVGAGMAGLAAAFELERLGFAVQVIEAQVQPGGRTRTLRHGDTVRYEDGSSQSVSFERDLYFNAGAGRIPSTHTSLLGYCRELGVPLEVMSIFSRTALCVIKDQGVDKRYTVGQLQGDARGHISELLAKSAKQGFLDAELNADDKQKLLGLLQHFGDLSASGSFTGTRRSGYSVYPGAGKDGGQRPEPLDFRVFLDRRLWYPLWYDEHLEYQSTMLQPVGGMDKIAEAFRKQLQQSIRFNTRVSQINVVEGRAQVVCRQDGSNAEVALSADYAIVTCPLPVVAALKSNLPETFFAAARAIKYSPAYKIGWETPRFWETVNSEFGGISFVDDDSALIWYPSHGIFSPKGILVGAYTHGSAATRYAQLSLAQQQQASRRSVERVHPGQSQQLSKPVSVAWQHMPGIGGGWSLADPKSVAYDTIINAQECFYFAGEHASQIPGWMEGSVRSASRCVAMIVERVDSHSRSATS